MKSILMSIRPEWVAKILNGEKTIEIRKTAPKCELPIDVYIYCTNGGLPLEYIEGHGFSLSIYNPQSYKPKDLRGKVVAKFTLRKVEEIKHYSALRLGEWYSTRSLSSEDLEERGFLAYEQIDSYLTKCSGFAWYISDLVILAKPKELSEFGVKRAPQSWQYIEVEE